MNEPTKVYVVTQGEYSDCRNIGVFTSREKAVAAGGDSIEEWLLDNVTGAPGHYQYFSIIMDRDGNVRRSNTATPFGNSFPPEPIEQWPNRKNSEYGCYYFHEWGTDLMHAVKVANEKRARLIAEGKWQ